MTDFIDELIWRGRFHQATDEPGLRAHLADPATSPRRAYIGFDPTADSLTVGNLTQIITLALFQRAGHIPVVIAGGGTGLIGDPSGKTAERTLRTRDEVNANVEKQKAIYSRILDFSAARPNRANLLNNADWLCELSYLDALRDIGKHFSVNMMIQKDSVRERLHNRDQGISYTEFSYMILQAYDFLHLYEKHGVTLQMGGSDQWGNIVAGTDLISSAGIESLARCSHLSRQAATVSGADEELETEWQRYHSAGGWPWSSGDSGGAASTTSILPDGTVLRFPPEIQNMYANARGRWNAFGLTTSLITKADGGKFGKTESGAIWLTAPAPGESSTNRTSPYEFYQFWLNTADADVPKFLRTFTLLPRDEITALEAAHAADPGKRDAHRALARHMTDLLHGPTELNRAEAAARALFSGDVRSLDFAAIQQIVRTLPADKQGVPSPTDPAGFAALKSGGLRAQDLIAASGVCASNREIKESLAAGAIAINATPVTSADQRFTPADLVASPTGDSFIALVRRGKKTWGSVVIRPDPSSPAP
ncbi:MAG: tyrosine--tRNA ligase [Planctomycetota bacterium]|nr:tyrosine--tRNA ligase [Planctomycetota bacterium]